MADFVRLTKNGLVAYEWNPEVREYEPQEKKETTLLHLRSRCEIAEDVTLGDIFNAVQEDPLLTTVISSYSWCGHIAEFHEQAKLPPPNKIDEDALVAIIIEPFAELHSPHEKHKDEKGVPDQFEGISMNFSGLGKNGTHFSISCTPMNELAHLPVKLITTITFNKNFEQMFKAEYSPSLLEVLDAIYWDISFYGGPEDNTVFLNKLNQMVDDIDSGKVQTHPFDIETLNGRLTEEK